MCQNTPIYGNRIVINGVGGQIRAKGSVDLTIFSRSGIQFQHNFYVFDSLPCKASGILGLDFLTRYGANINIKTCILTLSDNGIEYAFPLLDTCNLECPEFLTIPPRCESIHYIEINSSVKDDCVISAREIGEHLFLASAIVKPKNGRVPIKILNTSEKTIQLPIFNPIINLLSEYDIYNLPKTKSSSDRAKILLNLLDLKHLNLEEKSSIESICKKYSDIFHLPGDKLTKTDIYESNITLKPNSSPVYVKPYRIPHSLKPEVSKQIKKMIDDDIIEETKSEWSSPILLVPKKSEQSGEKKWRLVVDYRKLNETIHDDKFPLPNIADILDSLSGSILFSHLDLNQGFYQIPISSDSKKVTAFTTNTGQYQMKRLPMGLKISPSAFSRAMTVAMSGLTYEKCFVYLDDLVVFGRNLDDLVVFSSTQL